MKATDFKHTTKVVQAVNAIPGPALARKVLKSAFGLVFIAGAVLGAWKLAWPWYVVLALAMFGAHVVSEELTRSAIKFLLGVVKDLLAAVRGAKDNG